MALKKYLEMSMADQISSYITIGYRQNKDNDFDYRMFQSAFMIFQRSIKSEYHTKNKPAPKTVHAYDIIMFFNYKHDKKISEYDRAFINKNYDAVNYMYNRLNQLMIKCYGDNWNKFVKYCFESENVQQFNELYKKDPFILGGTETYI